jgi:hypothetical protein
MAIEKVEMRFPIPGFDGATTVAGQGLETAIEPTLLTFTPAHSRRGNVPVAYLTVLDAEQKPVGRSILVMNGKTGKLALQNLSGVDDEGDDDGKKKPGK